MRVILKWIENTCVVNRAVCQRSLPAGSCLPTASVEESTCFIPTWRLSCPCRSHGCLSPLPNWDPSPPCARTSRRPVRSLSRQPTVLKTAVRSKCPAGWRRAKGSAASPAGMDCFPTWTPRTNFSRWLRGRRRILERVQRVRRWRGRRRPQKSGWKASRCPSVSSPLGTFSTACPTWTPVCRPLTGETRPCLKTGWRTNWDWRRTERAWGEANASSRSTRPWRPWASTAAVSPLRRPGTKPSGWRRSWGRWRRPSSRFLWPTTSAVTASARTARVNRSESFTQRDIWLPNQTKSVRGVETAQFLFSPHQTRFCAFCKDCKILLQPS